MGLIKKGSQDKVIRPVEFIWVLDVSGSMHGKRIDMLNKAIRDLLQVMKRASLDNNMEIFMRVLTYSTDVKWHIAKRTPIKDFVWQDICPTEGGLSNLGLALTELANNVNNSFIYELPPVIVLITDGEPTDDYKKGIDLILSKPWANEATRLAIAIDGEVDRNVLEDFIFNNSIKPIEVYNTIQLVEYLHDVAAKATIKTNLNSKMLVNFAFKLPEEENEKEKTSKPEVYDIF